MADQAGKFNIKALRQQAAQSRPDDQIAGKPDNQMTRQPDDQMTDLPTPQTGDESAAKRVNLCVKVPESWRKHWAIQAKVQDVTMTEVMIAALTERFGLPDDQTTR